MERWVLFSIAFLLFLGVWYSFHGPWPARAERPAPARIHHAIALVVVAALVAVSLQTPPSIKSILGFYTAAAILFAVWFDLNRVRHDSNKR